MFGGFSVLLLYVLIPSIFVRKNHVATFGAGESEKKDALWMMSCCWRSFEKRCFPTSNNVEDDKQENKEKKKKKKKKKKKN
jgi:hypothetical protein